MYKYIAGKPVRFDRDYEVDEPIPAHLIDSNMEKRLIESGKIIRITVPDDDGEPQRNLLGGNFEESVVTMERLLGITPNESQDLDQRAEICRVRLQECKTHTDKPDDDSEEITEGLQLDCVLKGGTQEERIAASEAILGIEPNASFDLETRANDCLDRLELILGAEYVPPEDSAEDNQQPQGNPGTAPTNVQTVSMTGGNQSENKKDLPDATCPVCNRVMGSKAALTTHMKKEHPDHTNE